MVPGGMNKTVSCVNAWGSPTEKNLWAKKFSPVSHQGVLWAQEPWLLLGMAWEWRAKGIWGPRGSMLATEWELALNTSFLPISLSRRSRQWNCQGLPFTAKLGERGGAVGVSIALHSLSPCSWVQDDLGTKDERQKHRCCWLGVWQSMPPHAWHLLITYYVIASYTPYF